MFERMTSITVCGLICVFVAFGGLAGAAENSTLNGLDAAYVADMQRNSQTVSHREGLKNTIDCLLNCAATDRIEVAMIGMSEVPDWVIDAWTHIQKAYKEVSISRYSMFLSPKQPAFRSDFYRFRTVLEDGKVFESLFQNAAKAKKAVLICTFIDGEPVGEDKALASALGNLLVTIEEGQITKQYFRFNDVPWHVTQTWRRYAKNADEEMVRAERFTANTPGGDEIYWRLLYKAKVGYNEQDLLVYNDKMVYYSLNGRIIVNE